MYQLEISIPPNIKVITKVIKKIQGFLSTHKVDNSLTFLIAIEELIANIILNNDSKDLIITLSVTLVVTSAKVEISDNGKSFNPLTVPNPDITSSLEKRKLGGLGVYFAKKFLNRISYERSNQKNTLRISHTFCDDIIQKVM